MANTSNYTEMGGGALNVGRDPDDSLSQEEKDLRLAMALQKQENASAYDASKRRHDQAIAAQKTRTGRSSVGTRLPHIRRTQKGNVNSQGADHGMYNASGDDADFALAESLQKEEQVSRGTAIMVERMVKTGAEINASSNTRNSRTGYKK